MSGVLEKTLTGLVHSVFGAGSSSSSGGLTKHGAVALPGLKSVSLGLIHFVEKLQAAQRISKQVRLRVTLFVLYIQILYKYSFFYYIDTGGRVLI